MQKNKIFATVFSIVFSLIGGKSHAALCEIDQAFDAVTGNPIVSFETFNGDSTFLQTFTAGRAGILCEIGLQTRPGFPLGPPPSDDLLVEIFSTSGGVPTMNSLGSVSVPASQFPPFFLGDPSYVTFDVSSLAINVNAGDTLAIEVDTLSSDPYSWLFAGDGYAGGEGFVFDGVSTTAIGGVDFGFRTYLAPIPEPSSALGLATLAICAIGGLRLRNATKVSLK